MPLNVRRYCTSVIGVLLFSVLVHAQAPTQTSQVSSTPNTQMGPPTSGDVMRDRISKSKAFIAVRNYNAAVYELENIRRESADPAVQSVVDVLLMNSFLEQGDFKRAQELLVQSHSNHKNSKPNAATTYAAVAGQVIKGARSRAERYKALGLSVSDRLLPLEALNDLDKMRELLEVVIQQATEAGADKERSKEAMAMLEEATNSRSMIARDSYDSRRWTDELADTRAKIADSHSVVRSSVVDPNAAVAVKTIAEQPEVSAPSTPVQPANTNTQPAEQTTPPVTQPVSQPVTETAVKTPETVATKPVTEQQPPPPTTREREVKIIPSAPPGPVSAPSNPVYVPTAAKNDTENASQPQTAKETAKTETNPSETESEKATGPMAIGALIQYATSQARPVYPPAAKMSRTSGIVTVEITVDEDGRVAEVQKTSGPMMLQTAAKDAVMKWKFKPFVRDGQPVKATGFINFNFTL